MLIQGISRKSTARIKNVALPVIMITISALMLVPFFVMITTAFKTSAEVNSEVFVWLPSKFNFDNFQKVFQRGNWARYFFNSVFVTTVVTVVSLTINSLAGYSFARINFKYKNALFLLLMVGLLVPPQILMIPVFILIKSVPLAGGNNIFGQGGTGWINSYQALMMPHLAGAFGIFLCRQFYLNFPKSLDEAAEIEGCSKAGIFFRIFLPLSKPLLASLGVIKMTGIWNDYIWPLVVTNTEDYKTVQLALASFKNELIEWQTLMAATVVVTIPLIIVFLFAQKYFVAGMVTSGIKG